MTVQNMAENYGANKIQVLKGLAAVKKRPGMYIGDTDDGSGLHHMIYEVVDNAIDEALAGHCDTVTVVLLPDGSVSITDNGRGIPVDIHKEEGISAAEVIMTQLHAGGKFDNNSYKVSGGLHGVGVSVVNALSSYLELTIWRDGKEHFVEFENGITQAPLKVRGEAKGKRGTRVTFKPSTETFSNIEFKFSVLANRFRELAFLNKNVTIILEDKRGDSTKSEKFHYQGGIKEFVEHLTSGKKAMHEVIYLNKFDNTSEIEVDVCVQWNESYHENCLCFTNNIKQGDGGTHLSGYRAGLTRAINNYANKEGAFKKEKLNIASEDMREGMNSIISVKVPDPKFSSQTKDKLVSSEVRTVVENVVYNELSRWLEEHPQISKVIIEKIVQAARAREAARKARELNRKKGAKLITGLSAKLSKCQSNRPEECEVWLGEGQSAGGTLKLARDNRTQAILPLRGKILNVEKSRIDKVLNSEEICVLISALGVGIGEDNFNYDNLRFHKIIIASDADVDGAHIRTLILTFFYRHMRELIEKGHLFIAQPPLFKAKRGKSEVYLKDEKELNTFLTSSIAEDLVLEVDGVRYAGADLQAIIEKAEVIYQNLRSSESVHDMNILEFALIHGYFLDENNDEDSINNIAQKIITLLTAIEDELERVTWEYKLSGTDIHFTRIRKGVRDSYVLNGDSLSHHLAVQLSKIATELPASSKGEFNILTKTGTVKCLSLCDLIKQCFELAHQNMYITRFKGLGEMDPEPLWDTTMNPETRVLLQVKIEDFENADNVFSTLMGDVVEPRKKFIQNNALKVVDLDA